MGPKKDLRFDEVVADLERSDFDHDGFRETPGSFDCDLSLLRKRPRTLGMARLAGGGEELPPDDRSNDGLDALLCEPHMKLLGELNMKGMRGGLYRAAQKVKLSKNWGG